MDINRDLNVSFNVWVSSERINKSKPLKGLYDPFMEDYLTGVADKLSISEEFYPDKVGMKTGKGNKISFMNYLLDRDSKRVKISAFVLKGLVGIGKTSFLEWWQNDSNRFQVCAKINISIEGLKFLHKDMEHVLNYIQMKMSHDLLGKLTKLANFNQALDNRINELKKALFVGEYPDFKHEFINQSELFANKFKSIGFDTVLTCIISAANEAINQPVWLLIDNVDQEEIKIQDMFIRSSYSTHAKVIEISQIYGWDVSFHLVVTARPETYAHRKGIFNAYEDIDYPEPEILGISKRRLFKAFDATANQKILESPITIRGKRYNSFIELSNHIKGAIGLCIEKTGWPFHPEPEFWHLSLVNRNVRRFIKSWVHMLLSGNFLDLWAFRDDGSKIPIMSPYRYLRMLIKGSYTHFPGNDKIDGYGEDPDSPLFFNLFGLIYVPGVDKFHYIKHYFIYIRILQYLVCQENKGVQLWRLKSDLKLFFDEDCILNSIRDLLWARLIDEVNIGIRDIGPFGSKADILLDNDAILKSSDTSSLYLNNLINEYTYLSEMAVVSYQLKNIDSLEKHMKLKLYRDNILLSFFRSMLEIILRNLEDYKSRGLINRFKSLFILPHHLKRPWLGAINSTISALDRMKIKGTLRTFNDELVELLDRYNKLRSQGMTEISYYIGDIYD